MNENENSTEVGHYLTRRREMRVNKTAKQEIVNFLGRKGSSTTDQVINGLRNTMFGDSTIRRELRHLTNEGTVTRANYSGGRGNQTTWTVANA